MAKKRFRGWRPGQAIENTLTVAEPERQGARELPLASPVVNEGDDGLTMTAEPSMLDHFLRQDDHHGAGVNQCTKCVAPDGLSPYETRHRVACVERVLKIDLHVNGAHWA